MRLARFSTARTGALLALAALSLSACGEDPSFRVRWAIAADLGSLSEAVVPDSPAACTALGIDGVKIVTTQQSLSVDERTYDCFAEDSVPGPALSPGSYDVEVLGLRRSQDPWLCELPSDYIGDPSCSGSEGCACVGVNGCDPEFSCAVQFNEGRTEVLGQFCSPCTARSHFVLEVVEGETPTLEAELIKPPECDDGLDNDADGLTDSLDPACAGDPLASESADFTQTVLDIEVTFLQDNKAAECVPGSVNATPLGVGLVGLAVYEGDELRASAEAVCARHLPLERLDLPSGQYRLEVTGLSIALGENKPAPVTETKSFDFDVAGQGSFVSERVDFAGGDFLVPVAGPVAAAFQFDMDGNDNTNADVRGCMPVGSVSESPLVIEEVDITIFDVDGDPVDPASLGFVGASAEGDASRVACSSTEFQSASLDWGSFSLFAEARANDTVCFTSLASEDLLPTFARSSVLSRLLVDGVPPAGCEDCSVDDECTDNDAPKCVMGLCRSINN